MQSCSRTANRGAQRRANCRDNAPQESFSGRKKDGVDVSDCEGREQIATVAGDWIDYCGNERRQWDLAKLAPSEYYRYAAAGVYPLPFPPLRPKTAEGPAENSADAAAAGNSVAEVFD
ncbi:MAG: hypothetical protein LBU32_18655 [Clostridiales bacterium]|nr:hypothetical protein [Clostridiales bacterium]